MKINFLKMVCSPSFFLLLTKRTVWAVTAPKVASGNRLTAKYASCSSLTGWSGAWTETLTCKIIMGSAKSVTASFKRS